MIVNLRLSIANYVCLIVKFLYSNGQGPQARGAEEYNNSTIYICYGITLLNRQISTTCMLNHEYSKASLVAGFAQTIGMYLLRDLFLSSFPPYWWESLLVVCSFHSLFWL